MLLKPKKSTWAIVTFYSAADSVLDNVYAISKVYYVITPAQSRPSITSGQDCSGSSLAQGHSGLDKAVPDSMIYLDIWLV